MPYLHTWRVPAAVSCIAVLVFALYLFQADEPAEPHRYATQKSQRTKAEGYPDLYAEYHRLIRTAAGEDEPSYPDNYRMKELSRAMSARKSGGVPIPWVERGPGNVSGRTRAIVVDAADPEHTTWIAGAATGGIWKTTDAGASWINVAPELPSLAVGSLAQSLTNPKVIYAGTGEGYFNTGSVAGAGIFKSVDGGDTWAQLPATASVEAFRYVNRLVVDPNDENVVVAATRSGIYRSTNGGVEWTDAYTVPQSSTGAQGRGVMDLAAQPGQFGIQLASSYGMGILRSTDGGKSWNLANHSIIGTFGRVELAFAPSEPSRVYAAVDNNSGSELHMSLDAGITWIPLVEMAVNADADWLGAQGWYDNAIAVHPFYADTVFVGGIELWKIGVSNLTRKVDGVTGVDQIETESFLSFVNFGAAHFGGALETGDNEEGSQITSDDFVSAELRFGPGKKQKAHRFVPDDRAGIPLNAYPYKDYVEVPFEAWDIVNNRQLMLSFRDRLDNGIFDLIRWDENNIGREYIVIHALPYDAANPHPDVAKFGGAAHKAMYFTWPILAELGVWEPENLPESTLRITYSSFTARLRLAKNMNAQTRFDGGVHVDHHNITIIPIDQAANEYMIVNGNDGGVYVSTNSGKLWEKASGGYNTTQFYGVDKKPGLPVYIGGTQDNGTWASLANPTATSGWKHRIGGDGFDVEWHDENPDLVLGSIYFNFIQRSENGGLNFSPAYEPKNAEDLGLADNGQDRAPFVTQLGTTPANPDLVFAIGKTGVWRSSDFGSSWSVTRIPEARWGFNGGGKVAVSPTNANTVWAGSGMTDTRQLHVSIDGGQTFQPTTSSPLAPGTLSGLATHPHNDRTAYALFSAYSRAKILRTRDLGETWEDISGFGEGATISSNGFPNAAVYDLLVLPDRHGDIWAGTEIGLFISEDDGATWNYADNGLPAVSIWKMRIVDDEIVLATHGRGIWSVPLSAVPVGSEEAAALPEAFTLAQNYPNPFNPSTTIEFDVPSATHVRVSVFDVAGRLVATLANEEHGPGRHQVVWDARGVASGMYFYRLTAGDFVETRSMTLLK